MNKITIRDVAREAGVSVTLVSFVMNAKRDENGNLDCGVNKDTAERVLKVASKLGYKRNHLAASLRSGKTNIIAFITSDIGNPFFSEIARNIENVAHEEGYTVLFASSDENPKKLENVLETVIGFNVDGLIVAPCYDSDKIFEKISKNGIPTVIIDRDVKGETFGRVMLNNEEAGYMATKHLIGNGYRKIEFISYTLGVSSLADREAGYRRAMDEAALQEEIKVHYTNYGAAQKDINFFFKDAISRKVDAFVLPANTITVLGMTAMNDLDISVPKDLGIVGFDDDVCYDLYKTKLTRVIQPMKQIGESSFMVLKRMIDGEIKDLNVILQPDMIIRDSSAPRRHAATKTTDSKDAVRKKTAR